MLSDLVERGLNPGQGMLFVIDGDKALRKAIRTSSATSPSSAASATRSATPSTTCPSATDPPSSSGFGPRGPTSITPTPSIGSERWPASSSDPGAAGSLRVGSGMLESTTRASR